jgi:hypothetical protein
MKARLSPTASGDSPRLGNAGPALLTIDLTGRNELRYHARLVRSGVVTTVVMVLAVVPPAARSLTTMQRSER